MEEVRKWLRRQELSFANIAMSISQSACSYTLAAGLGNESIAGFPIRSPMRGPRPLTITSAQSPSLPHLFLPSPFPLHPFLLAASLNLCMTQLAGHCTYRPHHSALPPPLHRSTLSYSLSRTTPTTRSHLTTATQKKDSDAATNEGPEHCPEN